MEPEEKSPDDVCRNRHGGDRESEAANRRVNKTKDKALIHNLIKATQQEGITLDELSILLKRAPNQISGRISELKRDGFVIANGQRRETRTGSTAKVYISI